MAYRVDIPQELLRRALGAAIQSSTRAAKASQNPIIKDALNAETADYNKALHTLTETK
jgi:hypothetical protein